MFKSKLYFWMAAHGQGDKESVLVSLGCLVQAQSYSNKTKRKQKEQQRNISKTLLHE